MAKDMIKIPPEKKKSNSKIIIKNVKFKIIKTRTGCQYVCYFYYSEHVNWAAQNLRLGWESDIAGLNQNPAIADLSKFSNFVWAAHAVDF